MAAEVQSKGESGGPRGAGGPSTEAARPRAEAAVPELARGRSTEAAGASSQPLSPYHAGAAAARLREPLVYNPHDRRTHDYAMWETGWHDYTDARRGRGLLDLVSLDERLDREAQLHPELARTATRRLPGPADELIDWKHYPPELPSPRRLENRPPEVRRFLEDLAAFAPLQKPGAEKLTGDEIVSRLRSGADHGVGYRQMGLQYTGDLQEALRHVPDRFKADFAGGYLNRVASYKAHVAEVTRRHLNTVENLDLALIDLRDSWIAGRVVRTYFDRALAVATVDQPLTSQAALEIGYRLGLQGNSMDLEKLMAAPNLPGRLHLEILRGHGMGSCQSVWHCGSLAQHLPHDPRLEPLALHRLAALRPTYGLEEKLHLVHQGPSPKLELLVDRRPRLDAARRLGIALGKDRMPVAAAVQVCKGEPDHRIRETMGSGFIEGRRRSSEWVELPDVARRDRLAAAHDYAFALGEARYPIEPLLRADLGDDLRRALSQGHAEGVVAATRSQLAQMDGLARSALAVRSADHHTRAAATAARLKLERFGGLAAVAERLGLGRTRDYLRASSASAAQILARSSRNLDRIRSLLPRITGGIVDLGSLLTRSEIRGLATIRLF